MVFTRTWDELPDHITDQVLNDSGALAEQRTATTDIFARADQDFEHSGESGDEDSDDGEDDDFYFQFITHACHVRAFRDSMHMWAD